ncbi:two-component system, OmpR family, phosphate regulon sensor histidine kinase PhoR [Candidatus Magnetomoraceae bacterium gMMP-15]
MKKNKKLIWQLYPSYLLIIVLSLAAVSWYASHSLRNFFIERTEADLKIHCYILEKQIARNFSPLDAVNIDKICKEINKNVLTRITVMLPNGKVIGDSIENPANMDNHADRPEVIRASAGQPGSAIRYSRTLSQNMMYAAIPLIINGRTKAVIRCSVAITSIENEVESIQIKIAFGGFIIALLASGICLYVSRRISRPIENMRQGAEHFASGDLLYRLHPPRTKEMADLAESMNQMAAQLEDRIKTVTRQHNEIGAIFSSMLEGVIAVDMEERIINMNQIAMDILQGNLKLFKGRNIQEVVRNQVLHKFIKETIITKKTIEGDIVLLKDKERILNICCTPLCDGSENLLGALIVLNDVTKLRHLENVRQDFVANVSHELKTPLTAIQGFVETLSESAVDNPGETARFLNIIKKHVVRMTAIIENLLELSRIENINEKNQIQFQEGSIKDVIESAIGFCQAKADKKQIKINLLCDDDLSIIMDIPLFEQAIINLLNNAITYSNNEKNEININAGLVNSVIIINIQDHGIGIAKEHLTRIFERFYRVDKARTRKSGGTGLGLAIVKHIIKLHRGWLTVESTLGKGSIFKIHIPVS